MPDATDDVLDHFLTSSTNGKVTTRDRGHGFVTEFIFGHQDRREGGHPGRDKTPRSTLLYGECSPSRSVRPSAHFRLGRSPVDDRYFAKR